ncbi:hypothetical protein [Rhodopseudomonas sp. B29]|uniref:hypothetical protein n=1 Tax=Rhodopseudomonas sp. B29 TaxID=95607 RepID=UPI000349F935|nr:hypothetical protein [Rhodopseudomonas sp. B29]
MASCENARPAPLRCPTRDEVLSSVLGLLPRGRAWQSDEGGPVKGFSGAFSPAAFDNDAFATRSRKGSVLWNFWSAIAEVLTFTNRRLCDLRLEFWCATQTETRDLWMAEYGLPDDCDPFPDLCTKVAAIGGTRCEYYAQIAARAGWSISCVEFADECGARAGCAKAGRAKPGNRRAGGLVIMVDLGASAAFSKTYNAKPRAGRMKAGQRLGCGPDLAPLQCLLSRVIHAEIKTAYGVTNG